jgi:hypothetical protein
MFGSDRIRNTACDDMGEKRIAQQRHSLLLKNTVAKIVNTVASSRHPFPQNKMVAPPTFHGGTLSILLLNSLLSGLLNVMSMPAPYHEAGVK